MLIKQSYILVLGYTLYEARRYCALSLEKVAKDMTSQGLPITTRQIFNWEEGNSMPNKKYLNFIDSYWKKKIKNMDKYLGWNGFSD